jgi:putative ABC transport system permease protein
VRLALGASPRDVLRLVGHEALSTALPGLVVGLLLCAALAMLARGALFGVGPLDRVALLAGFFSIAAVVALASYIPARRALRVDPSVALSDR